MSLHTWTIISVLFDSATSERRPFETDRNELSHFMLICCCVLLFVAHSARNTVLPMCSHMQLHAIALLFDQAATTETSCVNTIFLMLCVIELVPLAAIACSLFHQANWRTHTVLERNIAHHKKSSPEKQQWSCKEVHPAIEAISSSQLVSRPEKEKQRTA